MRDFSLNDTQQARESPSHSMPADADLPMTGNGISDFSPGEFVVRAGDPARSRYYVVAGVLQAERTGSAGQLERLDELRKGDVIGFSVSNSMQFSLCAMTKVRIYTCTAEWLTPSGKKRTFPSGASFADMLALTVLRGQSMPTVRVAAYLVARFNRSGTERHGRESLDLSGVLPNMPLLLGMSGDMLEWSLATLAERRIIRFIDEKTLVLLNRRLIERFARDEPPQATSRQT